jgi:hypothetical protein
MEPGIIQEVLTKVVEGSPLIVLLLLTAVVILWRELKRERDERIKAVEIYSMSVAKIASDYGEFSEVLTQLINFTRNNQNGK